MRGLGGNEGKKGKVGEVFGGIGSHLCGATSARSVGRQAGNWQEAHCSDLILNSAGEACRRHSQVPGHSLEHSCLLLGRSRICS